MAADRAEAPFFAPDSLIRQVQRERAVALSGARALFMQAAHPVAFIGFFSHTGSADDPHPRLARTALAVNTVIFGTERQAREVQAIVGEMHARVRGQLRTGVGPYPAGTPFRGDDPELLRWILAAFIDSSYRAFERFVRPLTIDERERLWQEWRRVGEIFGLGGDELPRSYPGHVAYVEEMLGSGRLVVTPQSRSMARRVILNPPVPRWLAPAKTLVNAVTVEMLPADLRRQFGFLPLPGRGSAVDAFARWYRQVASPLAPAAVRQVPPEVMPAPGRGYSEIATVVDEALAR